MKTIDLIKDIYKIKMKLNPLSIDIYDTNHILSSCLGKKQLKLLRYKFQQSLFGKNANKLLYYYITDIFNQHLQKLRDEHIYKIIYNSGHHYVYKSNKNIHVCKQKCIIYNNIFFFTYDPNIVTILIKKFIMENCDTFNATWRLDIEDLYSSDIMFFAMHMHQYLNKHKKNIRAISINYYVKTENSYYPREFRISRSIYNTKNISVTNSAFVHNFYKTWRLLHLDDHYDASEEKYFIIKIRFKNIFSKKYKLKSLKLPPRLSSKEKESFVIKRKSYNKKQITHDFIIIG